MNSAGKSLADAAILDFEFPTGASGDVNFLTGRIWVWQGETRREFLLDDYVLFPGTLPEFPASLPRGSLPPRNPHPRNSLFLLSVSCMYL